MGIWSIKPQEIRAGGFTVRFGAHDDTSGTCYLQITGKTEGHQIMFTRDGDVLKITPIVIEGEPHAENPLAPADAAKQAALDAKDRADHNDQSKAYLDDRLVTDEKPSLVEQGVPPGRFPLDSGDTGRYAADGTIAEPPLTPSP